MRTRENIVDMKHGPRKCNVTRVSINNPEAIGRVWSGSRTAMETLGEEEEFSRGDRWGRKPKSNKSFHEAGRGCFSDRCSEEEVRAYAWLFRGYWTVVARREQGYEIETSNSRTLGAGWFMIANGGRTEAWTKMQMGILRMRPRRITRKAKSKGI